MGRVKFVLNLISFSSSLPGPIFYFYIYVSSSVLSYCSIKHDDDDDDVTNERLPVRARAAALRPK